MGKEMLRCAQHDKALALTAPTSPCCHPEAVAMGREMLHCAQHDKALPLLLLLPLVVTRSEAKGLSRRATRCFSALSMTVLYVWLLSTEFCHAA